MRDRFNVSAWAVRHPALILFSILLLLAGGYYSWTKLGRSEDPSFTIKVAVVTAYWPGATAQEMQEQVADRIEKKMQELPYFDRVQTYTKPGFSAFQMQFKDTTPPAQVPYLFYLLRKKLADVRGELPSDVLGPIVNDEYGDVDSILFAITGEGANYAQLKTVAEDLRQRLLSVQDVVKVNVYGVQDQRIFVELSHARLAALGVTPQMVFEALAKQNAVTPAGIVDTNAQRIPLRVSGELTGAEAVAETPVAANGKVFRLGDVATVTRGFEDPPRGLVRQKGAPALVVGVVMQKGGDIEALGRNVAAAADAFSHEVPAGIVVEKIADQPEVAGHAIYEFVKSFLEALAIVLFVSFLSLGWRTGIVVALSVPLVLAIVMIVMEAMGLDLHRITLGALIIALGLLVDDAIIAVEMMMVKIEQGLDRASAAAFAWQSTAFPMLTGTLVTAAGFLPVGFARSSTGEYAGGIFWVVAIALLASWVVAVVFTPYIGFKLLPAAHHATGTAGDLYETRVYRMLRAVVRWCVSHRVIVVGSTALLFAASVFAFGFVQQQFFPRSERPELFLEMRLPEGSSMKATVPVVEAAEALLKGDPDIETYTSYIGQGSPRFWLGLNPQLPNEAFAQIVIKAKDVTARERLKARLETAVHEGKLAEARVRVDRFNFGPPVGFPVQFRVTGSDPLKVRQIAREVRRVMEQNPHVIDPHLDWNERTPSVQLTVDQERARVLGVTTQEVSQALQTLLSGTTATTVRDGTEQVPVVVRATEAERTDIGRVADLSVLSRDGVAVPLAQVAKVSYTSEDPILWRRNRDLTITVRADIVDGVQAPDVTAEIEPNLAAIRAALPAGYHIATGGAVEESAKANASLFAVFPFMLAAMLTILMIQLQSFSRLGLVLLTAPLGLIGAAFALNLAHLPFGFVALLGLIALAGMIMRNTVILVDQIDRDVAEGQHTLGEAIVEATVRRARPVVLTAAAAILAMIPLASSPFWGPMAVTIMGGLFVATFLTLLFVPALFALWNRRALGVRPSTDHLPAVATGVPA
ncbi:MAG: efflux RND transporter permease subunit [Hyphomicrobiales bacterium]